MVGLNTFTPQPSTPDLHQRGYIGSLQHRFAIRSDAVLLSQFTYKKFDGDVTPNSSGPYTLSIETTIGGSFDRQARRSERAEWHEMYQNDGHGFAGAHELKFGLDYVHDNYDGRITISPGTIVGMSNVPVERISFGRPARFSINQDPIAWFIADKWRTGQRLTFDLGLRFDHRRCERRAASRIRPDTYERRKKDGVERRRWLVLRSRTAQRRVLSVSSRSDCHKIVCGWGNPRVRDIHECDSWRFAKSPQLWLESRVTPATEFGSRNSSRSPAAQHNSQFRSRTPGKRRCDVALEYWPQLLSRVSACGPIQGQACHAERLLCPVPSIWRFERLQSVLRKLRESGHQSGPERATGVGRPESVPGLGSVRGAFQSYGSPDRRRSSGFPYSVMDQARAFVGLRNSERFPRFASMDTQLTHPFPLPFTEKVKARIGFSVFNLLNWFNPRYVQSNIDSDRFDAMSNGVGRMFRGKFVLEF